MLIPIAISVIQLCFLPGFILLATIRNHSRIGLIYSLTYSFALSLIINYVLVTSLTFFYIYTRTSVIIIIVAEFFLLLFMLTNGTITLDYNVVRVKISAVKLNLNNFIKGKSSLSLVRSLFFSFCCLALLITIYKLINNIGNIFSSWDAVVSWNRWATDFFHNELPSRTWHYPQLLPANWSLSYVILDYPFQFIARGIMPLFSFFMLLILFAYGVKSKSIYPFFALILLYILTVDRGGFAWTDGYADVPLAFFSTITIVSVLFAQTKNNENDVLTSLILGILFACGAAVTKQAGIFLLITLPGFVYYYFKKNKNWTSKVYLKFLIIYIILLFIVVLPFYLYTEINIIRGIEDSEISWVTDGIFRGATYSQRFSNAIDIFSDLFGSKILFMIFTIFWIISSLRIVLFRSLAIFITIPFFIIWALFFSYDIRNSILLIPFYCFGVGGGFEYLIKNLLANFQKKNEFQIP